MQHRTSRLARGRGERAARAGHAQRVAARAAARCAAGGARVRCRHGAHRRDHRVEPADHFDHRIVREPGAQSRRNSSRRTRRSISSRRGSRSRSPSFSRGADETAAARARADQAKAAYENAALSALRDATRRARGRADVARRDGRAGDAGGGAAARARAGRAAICDRESRAISMCSMHSGICSRRSWALSQAQLQQLTAAVQLYKALGGTWKH